MKPAVRHDLKVAYPKGRITEARKAVAEAATRIPGAFTVEQLSAEVRGVDPAVGLATVYRAVTALVESGWLERVGERGDSALFMRCAEPSHHHHIVCEGCGKTAHAHCDLDRVLESAAEREGFTLTRHNVAAYGLCDECIKGGGD